MGNNFFKSKKNVITFTVAICLVVAILVTVLALLLVKAPKAEYVTANVGDFSVYYDKNGVDSKLTVTGYIGNGSNFKVEVPEKFVIEDREYVVTEIGEKAFSGQNNVALKEITELTLPATITKIGSKAFESTENLTTLEIKGTVNAYGNDLFYLGGIKNLTIDNLTSGYGSRTFAEVSLDKLVINNIVGNVADFKEDYSNNINTKALYLGKDVVDATMLRPTIQKVETLSYFVTTKLFSKTFMSKSSMTALYVHGMGTVLDSDTLSNVANEAKKTVKNIYLDEACSTINENAFDGFEALENVQISGKALTINLDALTGASASAKISFTSTDIELSIENGTTVEITSTYMNSFANIENITSVKILNEVKQIRANAFSNAENLSTITFRNNSTVEEIENGAFGTLQINFKGPTNETHYVYLRLTQSADFAANVKTYNA